MNNPMCYLLEIGPNLSSFLVQLLLVIGGLAAAYRGQSIVKQHAARSEQLASAST